MQPLVGKYLSACFSGLKDRNNTVRKYNASAIGHLITIAKVSSKFIKKIVTVIAKNKTKKNIPFFSNRNNP